MQLKESQLAVVKVIDDLLNQIARAAHFNHLINTKLSLYCFKQGMKYSEAIYEQNYRQSENQQLCIMEKEPNALIQDNFFPTATAIDQPQKTKQTKKPSEKDKKSRIIRYNSQISLSQISYSLNKKISKQQLPNQYQKLDLPQPQQQEAILKQFRKQVQEQSNKFAQNSAKIKDQKLKKKEGKQQKLGFDYNGEVIRLRSQNRNSLISGGLDGETLKTIEKLKQANKNIEPIQIEYDKKDKKLAKLIRNNQIQFTDIKALLSEVKVSKGIKMMQDGRVIQQKKKIIPVKQLIKTLTSTKLTKDDYRRIKQTTGNVAHYDDYSNASRTMNTVISQQKNQAQQNLSQLRSASESKLSNVFTRRKSTITIGDNQLFQNLISGTGNQATYRSVTINQQQQQKQQKINEKFDSNDFFNLQYMKKGGSMQIKKLKSTAALSGIKLPKLQTNKQEMPRIRQKIKDKQQIVRAIRRKFQQKLRT